jgi:hypothetical protein
MICNKCNIEKDPDCFEIRKDNNRRRKSCRVCVSNLKKQNYLKNKEIILKKNKEYILNKKDWKKNYDKKRDIKLKELRNKQRLDYYHKRKVYDVDFRIRRSLRSRMYFAVKYGEKCDKTMNLIGCDIYELKKHLESKFLKGMNWDNYGKNGWEIDHIIPCASFDLTNEIQQKQCFNYLNLQPLWVLDNILKSNKTQKQ